jgi:hypothetical protein
MSGIAPVSRSAGDRSPREPPEKQKRKDGDRPRPRPTPKPPANEVDLAEGRSHALNVSA